MATVNKVTKLYPDCGISISEADIQAHIDSMNQDGWVLIFVENFVGWYRFYWSKTT